jgi:hypothetical protein
VAVADEMRDDGMGDAGTGLTLGEAVGMDGAEGEGDGLRTSRGVGAIPGASPEAHATSTQPIRSKMVKARFRIKKSQL